MNKTPAPAPQIGDRDIMKLWPCILAVVLLVSCSKSAPPTPSDSIKIDSSYISYTVSTNTSIRADHYIFDSDYRSVSHEEVRHWASLARSAIYPVNGEQVGDCDDYARKTVEIALDSARANREAYVPAIGLYTYRDMASNHSANIFITRNWEVLLLEPQTGEIRKPGYDEGLFINLYLF